MIGVSAIISKTVRELQLPKEVFSEREDWIQRKKLINTSKAILFADLYANYPITSYKYRDYSIFIEGLIYNIEEMSIRERINGIIELLDNNGNYEAMITSFVDMADGEYVIHIFNTQNGDYLIFNDYSGLLPVYYYHNNRMLLISRNINNILAEVPEIKLNKMAIADFVMLGYQLSNDTYFQDIVRLDRASILYFTSSEFSIQIKKSVPIIIDKSKIITTKKRLLEDITETFHNSVKIRYVKMKERYDKQFVTLSGGYDSRALLGVLSKLGDDINYITYKYIQDESTVAETIFDRLGRPGNYNKSDLELGDEYRLDNNFISMTGGMANYFTTNVCLDEQYNLKEIITQDACSWHGLPGEFYRRPYKLYTKSLYESLEVNFFNSIKPSEICEELMIDRDLYKKRLESIDRYALNKQAKLRLLYYNYHIKSSMSAGIDRSRMFHWEVSPFCSISMVKAFLFKTNLKYINFEFFIKFLHKLDSRLLEVNMYGSKLDIDNKYAVSKFDKMRNKIFSKKYCKGVLKRIIKIKAFRKKRSEIMDIESIRNNYLSLMQNSKLVQEIFSGISDKLLMLSGRDKNRIITLQILLNEIEKQYPEKLKYNN